MIQVVFWFYNLSITFASVVVCMHANLSWSQVLHISYLGIDTATQRRVLQLYIVMPNPLLVAYHAPYVSNRDIIVVLISGPKPSGPEPMEIWEKRLVNNVPTICYWTTVREYLLINCRFIRGQRVGHWPLTLNSCNELCPWFFAFGHTNYARWLPVFLKDMAKLPEVHPAVHDAFMEGMCVVKRGDKKCYCGSSRYGSSYTYHTTSACQYFWRVKTYAAETFSAVDRIWNRKNMQR